MEGYERTTVGKAFEASFDNVKWETATGKKGERIVRFSGTISKGLHESVTGKIKQQLGGAQNPQEVEADLLKIQLFQAAINKFGGQQTKVFQDMNQKRGCELSCFQTVGGAIVCVPKCAEESASTAYLDEVVGLFINESWKSGTPVQVEWVVRPDGKSFEVAAMSSPAWEGITFTNILAAIYK